MIVPAAPTAIPAAVPIAVANINVTGVDTVTSVYSVSTVDPVATVADSGGKLRRAVSGVGESAFAGSGALRAGAAAEPLRPAAPAAGHLAAAYLSTASARGKLRRPVCRQVSAADLSTAACAASRKLCGSIAQSSCRTLRNARTVARE
jgi:hypothetical protein